MFSIKNQPGSYETSAIICNGLAEHHDECGGLWIKCIHSQGVN